MSRELFSKQTYILIAMYGFILNAIWEFAQAGPLYDMWEEVSTVAGMFHITMAIFGDVVMVVIICILAGWICDPQKLFSLSFKASVCMLILGFIAGMVLEWTAKVLGWWTYNEQMPTITLFEETVGLSPLLQMTLLPFFSMLLAVKAGKINSRSK